MRVVGFNGGTDRVHEDHLHLGQHTFTLHDAAAVILDNGEVVAAIEQERLDRIKHSNKAPVEAINFCLEQAGLRIDQIDAFANYTSRQAVEFFLKRRRLAEIQARRDVGPPSPVSAPAFFREFFEKAFGYQPPDEKLAFVNHHMAHAHSAYALSGFADALVLTIDGEGEGESGRVFSVKAGKLEPLKTFSSAQSLGIFYDNVIRWLGFKEFDEYKVMGLAPYGDPARFRTLFQSFYTLLGDGDYAIATPRLFALFETIMPRRKEEPITQVHHDLAAALQEALETLAFHVVRHFAGVTGHRNLAVAGGVGHNCTLNGKLLNSGMFDRMFIQPAAHDAGCALGAAYATWAARGGSLNGPAIQHVFWGRDIGSEANLRATLERWQRFLAFEKVSDSCASAAKLLADGKVIGWCQDRSEFGPRALGNRSILADPRPADNKDRINLMVKKREAFRPFAPAVRLEDAHDYFVFPPNTELAFMTFVVDVQPDKRTLLGAVTHVDGSARIQTVSQSGNPRFHRLLTEFKALTGLPVLLNTSFNNNAEPIVDSADDAIVCFLTTGLDRLVLGDFVISKREVTPADYLTMTVRVLPHVKLVKAHRPYTQTDEYYVSLTSDPLFSAPLGAEMYALLEIADGKRTVRELLAAAGLAGAKADAAVLELRELWSRRLIAFAPEQPT